jgi:hypothetical protein
VLVSTTIIERKKERTKEILFIIFSQHTFFCEHYNSRQILYDYNNTYITKLLLVGSYAVDNYENVDENVGKVGRYGQMNTKRKANQSRPAGIWRTKKNSIQ